MGAQLGHVKRVLLAHLRRRVRAHLEDSRVRQHRFALAASSPPHTTARGACTNTR